MIIVRHPAELREDARGAVVALGNFDGVHRGHQALLAQAQNIARDQGAKFAALVFEPYPVEFFRKDAPSLRLTPFRTKATLLGAQGLDILAVLDFNEAMASMKAQDFVIDILKDAFAASHVVVGEDFRFGQGRGGDATLLAYMGEMEGFGVTIVPPLSVDGVSKISSSRIRTLLQDGQPDQAALLLGHWWAIEGRVAHGDQRGRTIGFPTANLKLSGQVLPRFGVYAVRAHLADGTVVDGVANFGQRPTFELPTPLLEVHLFDFAREIYGELLHIEFIAFLRHEQKFNGLDALKSQIVEDAGAARAALGRAGVRPALDP